MSIKELIKELQAELIMAQQVVESITKQLVEVEQDISNHIYSSFDEAESFLYNMFDNLAHEDCEGSDNCGSGLYTQDFIVDGVSYTAFGEYEYNRHDKTYYYVDDRHHYYKLKQSL